MIDRNSADRRPEPPRSPLPLYDRARDLPRLVPLWPSEIADATAAGRARIVQRLRRALREERRRGMAGHWAYDLARHAALLRAYGRELGELRRASLAVVPGATDRPLPVQLLRQSVEQLSTGQRRGLSPCRRA